MLATYSPLRAPWTSALLLLVLIWTVWFMGMPDPNQVPELPSNSLKETSVTATAKEQVQESSFIATTVSKRPKKPTQSPKVKKPNKSITEVSDKQASTVGPSVVLQTSPPSKSAPLKLSSDAGRTLILYGYADSKKAPVATRKNLQFFIDHALHGGADFLFIFNGETDAEELVPVEYSNVRYVKRENKCYDLGAYAEVLTTDDLYKNYTRFIMVNASIRGPYMPHWADGCWSDMYLNKINEETKLVGMTANCWPRFHVQSMIWATDAKGMSLLLFPPENPDKPPEEQYVGINSCFDGWSAAVQGEVNATAVITEAGYKIDVMMEAFHGTDYAANCDSSSNGDVLWNGKYEGTNVHPFETIFMKTNRDIDPILIEKLTEWTDGENYSSWDRCAVHRA